MPLDPSLLGEVGVSGRSRRPHCGGTQATRHGHSGVGDCTLSMPAHGALREQQSTHRCAGGCGTAPPAQRTSSTAAPLVSLSADRAAGRALFATRSQYSLTGC